MRSHACQDVRGWNEAASASASVSAGLLALRLIGGSAMALHGSPKTLNPTSWMGPEGPPGWLQAMAAIAEFGGGLAWMAGALTPLACLGILATMITAIVIAHMPSGDPLIRLTIRAVAEGPSGTFAGLPRWLVQTDGAIRGGSGSGELALLFSGIAILLLLAGPGRFSFDRVWLARLRTRRRSELVPSEEPVAGSAGRRRG